MEERGDGVAIAHSLSYVVDAAYLLRDARAFAGLTQRELAMAAGTSQSVVARIENGTTSPSTRTLERLLAAAGATGSMHLVLGGAETALEPPIDTSTAAGDALNTSHMLADVDRILSLTPEARLQELANAAGFFASASRA